MGELSSKVSYKLFDSYLSKNLELFYIFLCKESEIPKVNLHPLKFSFRISGPCNLILSLSLSSLLSLSKRGKRRDREKMGITGFWNSIKNFSRFGSYLKYSRYEVWKGVWNPYHSSIHAKLVWKFKIGYCVNRTFIYSIMIHEPFKKNPNDNSLEHRICRPFISYEAHIVYFGKR